MAVTKRLLIISGDDNLRQILSEQFSIYDALDTQDAATAEQGVELALNHNFDLILIDNDQLDIPAQTVSEELRNSKIHIPLIILTTHPIKNSVLNDKNSNSQIIDYINKPFRLSILLAKLRTHLRNFEQSEQARFMIGPYEFKPAYKCLTPITSGQPDKVQEIKLTEKETNILEYLYRANDKPVSRAELLQQIWGYNANISTHTLETHIYRLRQKIEPQKNYTSLLITEPSGYRLVSSWPYENNPS